MKLSSLSADQCCSNTVDWHLGDACPDTAGAYWGSTYMYKYSHVLTITFTAV